MGLINAINVDGDIIKGALGGLGGLFKDIRTAVTGQLPPEKEIELMTLILDAERGIMDAQAAINKVEAANPSLFVSGWRPAAGWTCVLAMLVYYIPQVCLAVFFWSSNCFDIIKNTANPAQVVLPPLPTILGWEELFGLLLAMLGIGGLRTFEKFRRP